MNSNKNSDIDLMIVTKKGTLWTTRLLCYYSLITNHYPLRRPKLRKEKDMLCINLWLDESDMMWNKADRNIYTAHEIAQVVPLVNKNKIYEKFLWLNRWILNFWPFAVKIGNWKFNDKWQMPNEKSGFLEKICYQLQLNYMKSKITREMVSSTRAIFHPNDWGKVVMEKLKM
jgi:D-beta-D-heptose 7-phosphate kinase/D-beta-D-heptose 1-phosphate adenosyltransferase